MGIAFEPDRMIAVAAGAVTLHDRRTRRRWTVDVTPYALGATPITQARYAQVTGQSPSTARGDDLPVECVSWLDAVRFCNALSERAGLTPPYTATPDRDVLSWDVTADAFRLPTEAEWEYAARGGLDRKEYVWGDEQTPHKKQLANVWQGQFPQENTKEDGFVGTAPIASFPANGYGLYDMAGNVWEWCADWYRPDYYAHSPRANPQGPENSFDPDEPGVTKRVERGGSYLCTDLYCGSFRPSRRMKSSPDSSLCHTGFRCAISVPDNSRSQ